MGGGGGGDGVVCVCVWCGMRAGGQGVIIVNPLRVPQYSAS